MSDKPKTEAIIWCIDFAADKGYESAPSKASAEVLMIELEFAQLQSQLAAANARVAELEQAIRAFGDAGQFGFITSKSGAGKYQVVAKFKNIDQEMEFYSQIVALGQLYQALSPEQP
jgi:hypothetical protein